MLKENSKSQMRLLSERARSYEILYICMQNTEEGQSLLVQRKKRPSTDDTWQIYIKASYFLLLGTAISVLLAVPLIQSVVGFATVTNIPPFFIPYVVIPLTLSLRTAKQTITTARQKTSNSISLTLSQVCFLKISLMKHESHKISPICKIYKL